ncbi:uncharacterized protein LOC113397023 [Vanessa tameamea]|uniref:Uncharacterized protein LOC113397023 n=1 Tax=Vanessa tameamea TaxID=334116 RepID=A0A8B8I4A2_VANTA|nr:uncharacterized protein LOC113397023 [Vanessa tameamea]XP_047536926.1 uncharacterized protein LOC125070945 [Vanessa atalanta]
MMFSLCRRYKDENEHGGTQIKGGYMLRYKRKYLWSTWSEEWVVLYDDSTMAWFKDASAKCMATQKHLVKESPDMLAISTWTGQVPKRPPLPPNARLSQLMALGSRRDPGHVVWMLAKSDSEMKEWMAAISKTLPPPPHIELVMSMPYLRTAFKRPTVRVRPTTSSEMYARSSRNAVGALDGRGLVAVIKRQVPLAGQLDHELAWGQGWGWVTLPNGVWSGRLTWSQEGEDFALHAMPIMHHTNVSQACSMLDGVTAYEAAAYEQALAEYDDAATTSDDWDFGVDCGDFMM